MGLRVISQVNLEGELLDGIRTFIRAPDTRDDETISALIAAAVEGIENRCRRALRLTTLELTLSGFYPCADDQYRLDFTSPMWSREGVIVLPRPPLVSVTTVHYVNEGGTEIDLPAANAWESDNSVEPGVLRPVYSATWPVTRSHPKAVIVTYQAGYANAAALPASILHAIRILVGHWYENREATITGTIITKIPEGIDNLIGNYAARRAW